MDSDKGKLFIGEISWETSEDKLKEYFSNYGDVLQMVVMRDKISGRPRGFGFVVFVDHAVLDRVLQDTHTIDSRTGLLEVFWRTREIAGRMREIAGIESFLVRVLRERNARGVL